MYLNYSKAILTLLLFVPFISCNKESIERDSSEKENIETRSKADVKASPYTLLFQKETFDFDSKRALYSFLAKKDKNTKIFLAEVIVYDLEKEYSEKFGEDYLKDPTVRKNFEKELEQELDREGLPTYSQCLFCTIHPDQCQNPIVIHYFDPDYFKLRVYDEAQYAGSNYIFDDSKVSLMTEYEICGDLIGSVELPSLVTRGQIWDNKISSFKLNAELGHKSALVILHSEPGMTGGEYIYHLSETDENVWEQDLSDNFWQIRNIPTSVDNNVSSLSIKFIR